MKKSPKAKSAPRANDDTVIQHASETVRVASERAREYADAGVKRVRDGYEQFAQAAQDASEKARNGATGASLALLDAAKEDADATYEYARRMIGATSLSDAFTIHATFLKNRFDKRVSQAQELSAYVGKLTTNFRLAA